MTFTLRVGGKVLWVTYLYAMGNNHEKFLKIDARKPCLRGLQTADQTAFTQSDQYLIYSLIGMYHI